MISGVVYEQNGKIKNATVSGHYYEVLFKGLVYCGYFGADKIFARYYAKIEGVTSLDRGRLWTLYKTARQCLNVEGDFFECGVHKGGSASLLAEIMAGSDKKLHLFDTFCGMPETDPERDLHQAGDFGDTSIEAVREFVGHEDQVIFHQGFIPETFAGMGDTKIAFAHIDVDIYRSMKDCCEFIYPRLVPGGIAVFDDYGQIGCPGAREAVDEYFADKTSIPLPLLVGQAVVFKLEKM